MIRMTEERIPKESTHTNGRKATKRTRWLDQIRKDIEKREGNWDEVEAKRKWENRDSWGYLCDSRDILFLQTS